MGSQSAVTGGLSGVETPPIVPFMPNELFGARLAAGKSAVPAETMPMGPGSVASRHATGLPRRMTVAYETAYARGMRLLMTAGAGEEKVLAIVKKGGATPDLSKFLSFWKWSVPACR